MDATKTAAKAAAAGNADADAGPSTRRTAAPKPVCLPEEPLPAADPAPATATRSANIAESGVEDEQVERFYALLANIRAMRGMNGNGNGSDDASASTEGASEVCGGGGRKRARWAEPPWRPAFRMEDFEDAGASKKDRRDDDAASLRRPGKETEDEAADGGKDKDGDVARSGRGAATPSPESKV